MKIMYDALISQAVVFDLRIIFSVLMLAIASYYDLKEREVSDYIWLIFGIGGVTIALIGPMPFDSLLEIGFYLIIAPIAILVWRLGLFGGADALALIALAVIAPNITLSKSPITPFTTMTNAIIISISPMLINFCRNTILAQKTDLFSGIEETKIRKIVALFVGYKATKPKHSFSIEKKTNGKTKFDFSLKNADATEFCTKPNTWVTPGLPYLIFIAGGFIIQLIYGDLIISQFSYMFPS